MGGGGGVRNVEVLPGDEVVGVARVAKGRGYVHGWGDGLVVVDVVVGVHGAGGQGELLAKGLVEVVRPGLVGDVLGDGGVGGGFGHFWCLCLYVFRVDVCVKEDGSIRGDVRQCWNI